MLDTEIQRLIIYNSTSIRKLSIDQLTDYVRLLSILIKETELFLDSIKEGKSQVSP